MPSWKVFGHDEGILSERLKQVFKDIFPELSNSVSPPAEPGVYSGEIRTYLENQNEEAFTKDRKTQDAVIRNLEVIGEATGKLPEQIQKSEPEIDWRKIAGLRNILIHEYFGINLPIVWDIVQNKLGPLETVCRRLLERAAEPPGQETL